MLNFIINERFIRDNHELEGAANFLGVSYEFIMW